MIEGKRHHPQRVKEQTSKGGVSHRDHLFMEECGYAKHNDGNLYVHPPGGDCWGTSDWYKLHQQDQYLDPEKFKVEIHEDGTFTVEGRPFATSLGVFQLVKGQWVHPDEAQAQVAVATPPPAAGLPAAVAEPAAELLEAAA